MNVNLSSPSDGYGGTADKKLHLPVKGMRLTIEKSPPNLQGRLVITSVTMTPGAAPAPSTTP